MFTDFQRFDVIKALEFTVKGDVGFLIVAPDTSGRDLDIVFLELFHQIIHGQVGGGKFLAVDKYVYLHFIGAADTDFSYTGNR